MGLGVATIDVPAPKRGVLTRAPHERPGLQRRVNTAASGCGNDRCENLLRQH